MDKQNVIKSQLLTPDYPWNEIKPDNLGPTVMQFMEDHEPFFKRWSETWYNNFQFIYGNQSVRWSRRYGYAVDTDFLQRTPAMNTRAQTNISRVVAEALASLIYSNLPEWAVDTAEQSSVKGKRFKRIVQKLLDAYMIRLCMDKEFSTAAMIYTVFGQVAAQIDWNHGAGKLMEIPKWQKVKAPVYTDYMAPNQATGGLLETPTAALNAMGQALFEDRWEAVIDQMGKQVIDKFFAGDVKVDVLTPFEYRREVGSQGMHKTKYIQRIKLLDYDEFLDQYSDLAGRTKFFNSIKPVYSNAAVYRLAVRHFMRMQFTTPPGLSDIYQRPENVYRNSMFKNKVLVVEHYDRPHPIKWPTGRKLIVVNGECTNVTIPTYSTNKMDGWHPFVEAQWMNVAPSSLATGPMNDVISKNRELNVADSLIATAMRRNMGSQLLVKPTMGLDPQRLSGEPGMVHEVSDPFGARYLHDDMPLPTVLPKLREMAKDDVYETSGAQDALRGDRSKGVSSGYALRQLQEREEKRLTPARKNFEYMVAGMGEKIVSCLKANIMQLDDSVMGYLTRAAAGEFQPQDVVGFISSPIDYGVEIRVEESSMALKSKATTQATIQELGGNAAVTQRLSNDAKVLDEYLKYFDAETLRDGSATHRDRAQRENEQFSDLLRLGADSQGVGTPTVLFEDDDNIHIDEHTEFLLQNSDEALKNPDFLRGFIMHNETHRIQLEEKAAKLMPGTALQVPTMMAQASQSAPPTIQTIYQKTILDQKQAEKDKAKAAKAPQGKAPQAPATPAPVGSKGPPQTTTSAPSQNTPSAASQGGIPQ